MQKVTSPSTCDSSSGTSPPGTPHFGHPLSAGPRDRDCAQVVVRTAHVATRAAGGGSAGSSAATVNRGRRRRRRLPDQWYDKWPPERCQPGRYQRRHRPETAAGRETAGCGAVPSGRRFILVPGGRDRCRRPSLWRGAGIGGSGGYRCAVNRNVEPPLSRIG